jgi:hypothetical protein
MTERAPGEAVLFADIEWVEGSVPDPLATLTEDQRTAMVNLIRDAYTAGYSAGENYGRKVGGQEALQAATEISTMLSDRRWQRAIETLQYFQQPLVEAAS